MRIILDMDEVLSDFTGGALRVHGWRPSDLARHREPGQWELDEIMGLPLWEFWRKIDQGGSKFWRSLLPLPWFKEVVELVEHEAFDNWLIATSPSRSPDCLKGKLQWLQYYFGHAFDRYAITAQKHFFARPDTVLIDDREATVDRFIESGGRGIVFPTEGNSLFAESKNPVAYVRRELKPLKEKIDALSLP